MALRACLTSSFWRTPSRPSGAQAVWPTQRCGYCVIVLDSVLTQTRIKCCSAVAPLRAGQGICELRKGFVNNSREREPEKARESQREFLWSLWLSVALSLALSLALWLNLSLSLSLCFWLSVKHALLLELCKTTPFCRKTLKYGTFCRKKKWFRVLSISKWHVLRYEPTPDLILLCVDLWIVCQPRLL